MKGIILLNYGDNTHQIEEEEKNRFIRNILEQMGTPVDSFWKDEMTLSVDQKIKLRALCLTYNIQIIDDLDGHVKIFVDKEMVASFSKSTYKLKRDYSQLDPRKQLYIEMTINCWSMFEEQEE